MCGEKGWIVLFLIFGMGLPPRMRGKVIHALCNRAQRGITPAYAGKSYTRPV